jgi:hypothetical protein
MSYSNLALAVVLGGARPHTLGTTQRFCPLFLVPLCSGVVIGTL